jgi:hypothetical protein
LLFRLIFTSSFKRVRTLFVIMATKLPTFDDILSWPPPNYVDPETRKPLVLAVEIPLMVLVITFISARIYTRTFLVRALGLVSSEHNLQIR